jgi:hypothetical protein
VARLFRWSLFFALMGAGAERAIAATVLPGDLVVVDNQTGAVLRVDPATGAQTFILGGPSFFDIATEENGRFAATFTGITGSGAGEIDPVAASFTPLVTGDPWSSPLGVAAGKAGHILAADKFAFVGCSTGGTVFDVDPASGTAIAVLCLHAHPLDVVLESSDSVLIASENTGLVRFSPPGFPVFRILAAGSAAFNPQAIALASNGVIFAVSRAGGASTATDIFRIDPVTGAQAGVSSGGLFVDLRGIAVAKNGDVLLTDAQALPDGAGAKGAVFRVNPLTGAQTVVSSGNLFRSPSGIAIAGVRNGAVGVGDGPRVASIALSPSPNPARGAVRFLVSLPKASHVRLAVYDLSGRLVALLADEQRAPGEFAVNWNARVSAGLYFATLEAAGQRRTVRIARFD